MSLFATKLLVDLPLPFPGRTICLRPLLPRAEHLAERRVGRLITEPLEGRDRRAPQRRLLDLRGGDGPGEGIGDQLGPLPVGEEAAAGADDLLDLGQEVDDRGEAEGHPFERRLAKVARRRGEGEPGDGTGGGRIPAGRALAAEKRQERESMLLGAPFDDRAARIGERRLEPGVQVAAVGERAALDDAALVEAVHEEPRPRPRPGLFMYRLDERRVVEGGALSDGGNLHAWLEATLADSSGSIIERSPEEHGLTFLPFLGGERSTGWDPAATGAVTGLTFATTPRDLRQAALEGVAFRFAAIVDLLPEVEEIVGTGGGLLADREWTQLIADALARPVTASKVEEASLRGAAVATLERLGYEPADAPLGEVFRPREERAEAYRSARERQRQVYEELRGE